MYIKKLEYLQQIFKQDYLYSGITVKPTKYLPIGTPCVIDLNVPDNKKSQKLKELNEVKDYFKNESASVNVIFLFNIYNELPDFSIYNSKISKVCYVNDKPLIYDSCNSTFLKSSKKDIIDDNIFEQLNDQFSNNRFVNYVFEDVKSSNVDNVILNIDKIAESLGKNYLNNVALYQYPFTDSRILTDIVSVSFYKMRDVIPVFNYKKSTGICMDIMLTNSDINGESFIKQDYSITYRLLFAKYSENIFFIDGEPVKRPNDNSIANTLTSLYKLLKKSTPKDIVKSSSDKSIKKEQKKTTKAKS